MLTTSDYTSIVATTKEEGQPTGLYGGEPQNSDAMKNQATSYATPQYPRPQGGEEGNFQFQDAFPIQKLKWNDLWAGILLFAVFCGFVAVSGISIHGYAATKSFNGGGIYDGRNTSGLTTNTVILFAFVLASALVLSYLYVLLARAFTKQFIWITAIIHIVMGFATAIYMLTQRYLSGGIVFLLFTVLTVVFFITWIKRIPFSVLMLQTSIDVAKNYSHVYLVSLIGGIISTAFGAWFSVTLVAIYVKYQVGNNPACNIGAGGCSSAKVIGLIVFITFAAYWICEWLKNTIHVVVSGVYGSWYFHKSNFPKGATRGALRRALTYSYGSIAFGSLFVAVIKLLRQACSIARQDARGQGRNAVPVNALWVLSGLVSIMDWLAQFLNRYAFSHIALYGKGYIPAAKDTWGMIKDRGIDVLINDCLIGPVFTMGATSVAYFCAFLAYLYLVFTAPVYNNGGEYTPLVVAFSFVIGLEICNIFTTPLASGIDTIFVAVARDPAVLAREHPELYARMVEVYPHLQPTIPARE